MRTIVGIGESLRAEYPDRVEPAGAALLVPLQALRLGHVGIPISRIGQDAPGDELAAMLNASGMDLSHLQRDPDHPTGRLKVQAIGRVIRRTLDPHSAFDELQWDFDLSDIAPVADAIVCGQLGCRSSQARTVVERFLDEASSGLKVVDFTGATNRGSLRNDARGILERVDVALADEDALRALVPRGQETAPTQLAHDLCRTHRLACVALLTGDGGSASLSMVDGESVSASSHGVDMPETARSIISPLASVVLCHALLSGWTFQSCINAVLGAWHTSATATDHATPIPEELLRGPAGNGAS